MRRLKIVMVAMVLLSAMSLMAQPGGGGQGGGQGQRPQREQQQEPMTPEQMALRRTEMMHRIVTLDSTQMELVYNLMLSQYEPLPSELSEEDLKELSRKEKKALDETIEAEREARAAEFQISLYELLTPPQIELYEAYIKQREERRQQGGGQGQGQGQGGGQRPSGGQGGPRM